ncbi:hypothetical protein FACS1894161_4740 [Spirochaetia bacterium]|nr:hypothetical protein FACS1894161_4740 [Spirochaetia bacterium]
MKNEANNMVLENNFFGHEDRLRWLHKAGMWDKYTVQEFASKMLSIGMNVYEKQILPIEAKPDNPGHGGAASRVKGKIISFPEKWKGNAAPTKPEAPNCGKPMPSYSEYRAAFSHVVNFKHLQTRILWALYNLRIRSLEDLAKTPPNKIMYQRNTGKKTLEAIRAVLESNGLLAGSEWDIT